MYLDEQDPIRAGWAAKICLVIVSLVTTSAAQRPTWHIPLPSGIDSKVRFVSNDTIAFTTFAYSEQGGEGQIQLFDARDGRSGKTFKWLGLPNHSRLDGEANIVPLNESSFLVQIGPKLLVLSMDLSQLRARELPYSEMPASYNHSLKLYDSWRLVGASGNMALLVKVSLDGGAEKHWVSTESLLDFAVEPSDVHCCSGLSGTTVLFNADAPKLKPVSIQTKGAPAHDLCKTCFGISPTFATESYVFAVSWPGASFVVASPDGRLLYKQKVHDGPYGIEYSAAAADVPRVAVIYPQGLGRQRETYSVAVFDLAKPKEVRRQSVSAAPEVSEPAPGFQMTTSTVPHIAISPNGKRLAILVAGQLSMYELP